MYFKLYYLLWGSTNCIKKMPLNAVKWQESLQKKRSMIDLDHNYYDAYFNKARCLYLLDKTEEANDVLSKAISINPNDHEAYQNKAMTLNRLGKLDEAITYFDKALELNPDNMKAYHNRKGTIFEQRGKIKQAEKYYKKARKYP